MMETHYMRTKEDMLELLLRCWNQFRTYAEHHEAKDPPQLDKAQVNRQFAGEINDLLQDGLVDDRHRGLVHSLQKPGADILSQLTPTMAATIHMAVGVCTEAGELLDAIKKWTMYGKDLDVTNVVEELGDIEFYLEGIRQNLDILREETLQANMEKLGVRYRGGYSDRAAILRADKEPALDLGDDVTGD